MIKFLSRLFTKHPVISHDNEIKQELDAIIDYIRNEYDMEDMK